MGLFYYSWPLIYTFVLTLLVHAVCVRCTPADKAEGSYAATALPFLAVLVMGLLVLQDEGLRLSPFATSTLAVTAVAVVVSACGYFFSYRSANAGRERA